MYVVDVCMLLTGIEGNVVGMCMLVYAFQIARMNEARRAGWKNTLNSGEVSM